MSLTGYAQSDDYRNCLGCEIIGDADEIISDYARFVYEVLGINLFGLMGTLVGIYILIYLAQKLLKGKGPEFSFLMKKTLSLLLVSALLSSTTLFWNYIFLPVKDLMFEIPILLLQGPGTTEIFAGIDFDPRYAGSLNKLLNLVDMRFNQVITLAKAMSLNLSVWNPKLWLDFLTSISLRIIYFINSLLLMALIGEALMQLYIAAAIAPISIVCGYFQMTRSVLTISYQLVLNSILQILFSIFVICFSFVIIGAYSDDFPVNLQGDINKELAKNLNWSPLYTYLCTIGVLKLFALLKARSIANRYSGGLGEMGVSGAVGAIATTLLINVPKAGANKIRGGLGNWAAGKMKQQDIPSAREVINQFVSNKKPETTN